MSTNQYDITFSRTAGSGYANVNVYESPGSDFNSTTNDWGGSSFDSNDATVNVPVGIAQSYIVIVVYGGANMTYDITVVSTVP